ncbi:hypothetical protein M153_2200029154 [Pseudoloma neurophilia]|uniref:Uncharacterized protein n=1 Tax=Pseudoloma neurophilia TaxID=146866 RepID=A0A0R0M7X3_9MICR|nr:hypothetical protein M153_2200029154 [Pseudoloma neurophilia]
MMPTKQIIIKRPGLPSMIIKIVQNNSKRQKTSSNETSYSSNKKQPLVEAGFLRDHESAESSSSEIFTRTIVSKNLVYSDQISSYVSENESIKSEIYSLTNIPIDESIKSEIYSLTNIPIDKQILVPIVDGFVLVQKIELNNLPATHPSKQEALDQKVEIMKQRLVGEKNDTFKLEKDEIAEITKKILKI